ncbi:hypothetical protein NEMBOFW57_010642 [Staphylotrichum longicolle]|uniref:F-box domain-containing protein n=1 Tax=Staphylotrichum longicolle TaxID=669026 RepID=A0AAD4EN60_9PEZI|nr:hypothetical protein NEMBOFW57_010642 [Staphylotrichum longicolle]
MELNRIPPEVLSLILRQLLEHQDPDCNYEESRIHYGHLRNARLVCRQWNELATPHLFWSLTLDAHPDDGMWLKPIPFLHLINNEAIQRAVQNVVIQTHPEDRDTEHDADDEEVCTWATGDDDLDAPGGLFSVAVGGIARLPNLKALQISFTEGCLGDRQHGWWEDDDESESISRRLDMLRMVFGAIQKRRAANDADRRVSAIRSLTLKNMQNVPIPDFISSDLYKDVIKDIDELHLLIAHEYREHGPDHDLDRIERRTFEPYLQNELLPPLAHQLTSLTLAFRECWGVSPGQFDGKGLVFPNLRTLTLSDFVIGHNDQFDWVLTQKSLKTLRLDRCFIVSYMRILNSQWDEWHVPTHDWHEYPEGSFGHERCRIFAFSGTWETVYDRIREELPSLKEFCSGYNKYYNNFDGRENMGASLSNSRYIVFDSGLCPSPWIEANDNDSGELSFGNNDPAVCPRDASTTKRYGRQKSLNRAKETQAGDARAFEDLLRAVRARW